jgi:hypothetical protein
LQHYLNVFFKANAEKLALNRDINLAINLLPGKEPLYRLIYLLSLRELVALKEFLKKNLAKGFIQESKSPTNAPILFALKKDGSLRLYINYQGLNTITVKNRYPLSLISKIINQVQGACYFSKIDLKDAYYCLRIKVGDK